jgi:hypothetical protein
VGGENILILNNKFLFGRQLAKDKEKIFIFIILYIYIYIYIYKIDHIIMVNYIPRNIVNVLHWVLSEL